jgi:hypothetical protein
LIVKVAASAVIVASIVLARLLSEDGVARFAAGQAALFFTFAVASLTLFVVVVFDFDKWVETVPPVPKGALRRIIGRWSRRVRRAVGLGLAYYGIAMTWVWTRVGAVLGWVVGRSAARLARFWSLTARAGRAVLVVYRVVVQRVWSTTGHAFASMLALVGKGLELLWVALVRGGLRALVLYRAAMQWLWSAVGHVLVWTLALVGKTLELLWAGVVRGGLRALVVYRVAMHWLWSTAGRLLARAFARVGAVLAVLGAAVTSAGAWSLVRSGRGIKRLWWAAVGRGDEPTPKPIRRWYSATVDSAFGIPPEDTSVDVFGGRVASHIPNATDPGRAPSRVDGQGEKISAVSPSDAQQRRR